MGSGTAVAKSASGKSCCGALTNSPHCCETYITPNKVIGFVGCSVSGIVEWPYLLYLKMRHDVKVYPFSENLRLASCRPLLWRWVCASVLYLHSTCCGLHSLWLCSCSRFLRHNARLLKISGLPVILQSRMIWLSWPLYHCGPSVEFCSKQPHDTISMSCFLQKWFWQMITSQASCRLWRKVVLFITTQSSSSVISSLQT